MEGKNALNIVRKFFPDVKKVVDAKRPVTFAVKACDRRGAKTKNHKACAGARGFKRSCDLEGALMSVHAAYGINGETATRYTVPQRVGREVISFDRKAGFALAEDYELIPPSKSQRLGARLTRKPGRTTGKGRRPNRPRQPHKVEGLRPALSA